MGFIRRETRGKGRAEFFYFCTYNPKNRNIKKIYLGSASNLNMRKRVDFIKWIELLSPEEVERLKYEAQLDMQLNVPFAVALENALKVGNMLRKSGAR